MPFCCLIRSSFLRSSHRGLLVVLPLGSFMTPSFLVSVLFVVGVGGDVPASAGCSRQLYPVMSSIAGVKKVRGVVADGSMIKALKLMIFKGNLFLKFSCSGSLNGNLRMRSVLCGFETVKLNWFSKRVESKDLSKLSAISYHMGNSTMLPLASLMPRLCKAAWTPAGCKKRIERSDRGTRLLMKSTQTVDACNTANEMWIAIDSCNQEMGQDLCAVKQSEKTDTNLISQDYLTFSSNFRGGVMDIQSERIAKKSKCNIILHKTKSSTDTKALRRSTITPHFESVFEEISDPEQAQRDKECKNWPPMQSICKKLYKPTTTTFELLQTSEKTEDNHQLLAKDTGGSTKNQFYWSAIGRTNLDETGRALGEATSCRDSCLIALQNKQNELEKYIAFNDRTIDYDLLQQSQTDFAQWEETVTLEKESRSKLNKDTVKPYDYTYQNSLYEIFKPPSKTYIDQLERAKEVRKTMWRKTFVRTKPNIAKNVAFLPKTVASDTTIQKPKSYFKELYENTNKAWKWWIEKKCPSEYKWTQTTPSRPNLKWKPTGRIFSNVRFRWIPTGKLFNSCTGKVNSEPTHVSIVDIPHIHASKQTLGLSAGISFNGQKQQRIDLNADALYNKKQENLKAPFLNVHKTFDRSRSSLGLLDNAFVHISSPRSSSEMTLIITVQNRNSCHNNEQSSSKLVQSCSSSSQ
ncbi:hypothetical protein Tco_1449700 [Tanacetum coccineum]